MARGGLRVALVGATGVVGREILTVLEERSFPAVSLCPLASEDSAGEELEFRGETIHVVPLTAEALSDCDLVLCAAPGVLEGLLPELRRQKSLLVDVSGALELDASVPLFLPGQTLATPGLHGSRWLAIPRGVVGALGLALRPLALEAGVERVTVLSMESASGAGRRGIQALTEQTTQILNAMTGEDLEAGIFPQSLAFDCLPLVGAPGEGGESSEEQRLRQVLRRLLDQPALPIEVTRVRVPTFVGSLACVHLTLGREIELESIRQLWEKQAHIEVMPESALPTHRNSTSCDDVRIGRIRLQAEAPRSLAFVLAIDDLRQGSALAVVSAAEVLCGVG